MPARALPGTTVRLVSSGVPAISQVTLAAGTASCRRDERAHEVGGRRGHAADQRGVHVDAVAGAQLELVQAPAAGHDRRAAVGALVHVEVERPVGRELVAVLRRRTAPAAGCRAPPRPSISSTWRHGLGAPANASSAAGQRGLGVGGAARVDAAVVDLGRERLARPARAGRLDVVHAVAQDGRAGPSMTPITVGRFSPGSAISAVPPAASISSQTAAAVERRSPS